MMIFSWPRFWRGQDQRKLVGELDRDCGARSIRHVNDGGVCYECGRGLRVDSAGDLIFDASHKDA